PRGLVRWPGCRQAVRLLLDELLSPAIARELRERGHDVLAIADHPGWVALSDPEVMPLARTERRAVVTNNLRDYRPLHADAIMPGGPGHLGMISCQALTTWCAITRSALPGHETAVRLGC